MTTAHTREQARLQRIIAALEKQLTEDAEVRRLQADRIVALEGELATTRAELDDAYRAGRRIATTTR